MPFYINGRGAQFNTANKFDRLQRSRDHAEGIDEWEDGLVSTEYIEEEAKTLVNKVDSPDLRMSYSMNPYAGCEHGCIYCYARNAHEYRGFSAGLDFESRIIVKKNAPALLRKFLMNKNWDATPIMMSGNTDCYQPAEQRYRLTRQLLEICNRFNQPVGIVTKNAWILRDRDILEQMAKKDIVSVVLSITSLEEDLRRKMEPRTCTSLRRLEVVAALSRLGVRTGVLLGPVIPGLNDQEMPRIMQAAAAHGASFTGYTFIRLNGSIQFLFHDWLHKNFPDRAEKVWHLIQQGHDGKVNDSRWGKRMKGEGPMAELIAQQHKKLSRRLGMNGDSWSFNQQLFSRPGEQGRLF